MAELKIKPGVSGGCDKCNSEAKIILPYGPHNFCAGHFNEFFENRIRKTIRTNRLIEYGEKIAVGVSGGKDSMVTLHLLYKIFGQTGLNKIEAIMIDEGIEGYRDKSMEFGIKYCEHNGIKYHIAKFEQELGVTTAQVGEQIHGGNLGGAACSYCGVFRRQVLSKKGAQIKADKLATGHNMDDECQSILMSFFSNDFARLARLGELAGKLRLKGTVPRIKPLYDTPEKEIIAYAALNGIEHYSAECCPHSWMAKRNQYRKMLNELENSLPGTKHGIMASFRNLKPILIESEKKSNVQVFECAKCGEPANSELCATCRQMEKILATGKVPKIKLKEQATDTLSCAVTKGLI